MKIRCKCNQLAIWMYAPSVTDDFGSIYFCDGCVSRGCSCNIDYETGIEDRDDLGRLEPCCEYMFSEDGFDNDKPLDDSDRYDSDFDEA